MPERLLDAMSTMQVSVLPLPFEGFGRFGRIFPHLGPHEVSEALLVELGKRGGPMDGCEGAEKGDGVIPAGMTFVGQFIDHDITLDTTSSLERQNDPTAIHNFRTPYLELDSLYGSGPDATPFLYDQRPDHRGELLVGFVKDQNGRDTDEPNGDLPRNSQNRALIGDLRNDENLILAQLHLAFLNFHNALVRDLKSKYPNQDVFLKAQEQVRWHYQWIVVNEFLPAICDPQIVEAIFRDRLRFFRFEDE
jgi:hypothetical protein